MFAPIIGSLPRSIRTPEDLEFVRTDFEAFVASKPAPALFEDALEAYIGTIDLRPDCDPRSLGMQWLENNLDVFVELTDNADPSDFLLRCITSDFIGNVLYNKELLLLIHVGNRAGFVTEVIREQCPFGYDWIPVVKEVCPGLNIGELIFLRLLEASPESELFRDFTGTNRNSKIIWRELDKIQFLLAVHAVVRTKPELMFEADSSNPCFRQRVEARVNEERADADEQISLLMAMSGGMLTSLENVSYSMFKRLPKDAQHKLLRQVANEQMRCSILLVTELAANWNNFETWFLPFVNACIRVPRPAQDPYGPVEYDYTVSIAEYLELRKLFKIINQRNAETGKSDHNTALFQNIDEVYWETLEDEKYACRGTLVEDKHLRRRRNGVGTETVTRLIVKIEAFSRPPHYYHFTQNLRETDAPVLHVGDEVVFYRGQGERIYGDNHKTVFLTNFTVIKPAPRTIPKPSPRR